MSTAPSRTRCHSARARRRGAPAARTWRPRRASRRRPGEQQVVRAGLAGHVDAARPAPRRPARRRGRWRRGRCAARSPCPRRTRSRGAIASSSATTGREAEPVARAAARASRAVSASFSACTATSSPSRAADRHALVERHVVGVRELVDAAVGHERLEADDAALGELLEVVEVAGHEAAPEAVVDARRGSRGRSLASNAAPSIVGGRRVQRHVEERREAARGQRRGAGLQPFPVRAARLVEVHVRVEAARAARAARSRRARRRAPASSGAIAAIARRARRRPRASVPRRHDGPAAHDQVELTPRSSSRIARPRSPGRRRPRSTDSSGWWLMPPAQRTKSIATSVTRGHRHRVVAGAAGQLADGARRSPRRPRPRGRPAPACSAWRRCSEIVDQRHGHAAALRDRLGLGPQAARSRASRTRVVLVADVERDVGAAGDHVDRAARDVELADRRDEARLVAARSARRRARTRRPRRRRRGAGAIGVVPAWPAWPWKTRLKRLWPAIAVTTPSGSPSDSSTGPCSMWTSR